MGKKPMVKMSLTEFRGGVSESQQLPTCSSGKDFVKGKGKGRFRDRESSAERNDWRRRVAGKGGDRKGGKGGVGGDRESDCGTRPAGSGFGCQCESRVDRDNDWRGRENRNHKPPERPKLNLKPRSKDLSSGVNDPARRRDDDDEQQIKQRSNPFGAAANATRPHCEAVPASWKEKWVNSRQQQRLDEQKKEQQAFEEEEHSEQNPKQKELEEKMRKEREDKERQTHEDKILKKEATAQKSKASAEKSAEPAKARDDNGKANQDWNVDRVDAFGDKCRRVVDGDGSGVEALVEEIPNILTKADFQTIHPMSHLLDHLLTHCRRKSDKTVVEAIKKCAPLFRCLIDNSQVHRYKINLLCEVQRLCFQMGLPRLSPESALLEVFFDGLYRSEIIEEKDFERWSINDDDTLGKTKAMFQVNYFLDWLREAGIEGETSTDDEGEEEIERVDDDEEEDESDIDVDYGRRRT